MRGHSGETFHSRAGPRGGTRPARDQGCYPGRSPSPIPGAPRPPAPPPPPGPPARGACDRPAREAPRGAGFARIPSLLGARGQPGAGAALPPAKRAGARPNPAERRQVPVAAGTRGTVTSYGPPGAPPPGEGAERPRGRRGGPGVPPPGQGRQPGHRSARSSSPATAAAATCSARPGLRAAGSHSLLLALASLQSLPISRVEVATALFSFIPPSTLQIIPTSSPPRPCVSLFALLS